MASDTIDLLSSALALPVRERARIAHELLLSLDPGNDGDAADAWVAELERRAGELRQGSVSAEPWEAIRARIAESLRRR